METIRPDWPAPPWVRAHSTTRQGGRSGGLYASLNLGDHVGDDPRAVQANRALVRETLCMPAEPLWLRQMHGCGVAEAGVAQCGAEADAAVARGPDRVCAVLTADCLPLLFCDHAGTTVAAVHAGWRGLAEGAIDSAVAATGVPAVELLAWMGPAIGPDMFEVGAEVRARFLDTDPGAAAAFRPGRGDRWLADLCGLARRRLARLGVESVFGGGFCTHSDPGRFFSYRRDGTTGRMATLIWLETTGDSQSPGASR